MRVFIFHSASAFSSVMLPLLLFQHLQQPRQVAEALQLGDGLRYRAEAVGGVYEVEPRLHRSVVVALNVAYVIGFPEGVALREQSDILALPLEVVAVAFDIKSRPMTPGSRFPCPQL